MDIGGRRKSKRKRKKKKRKTKKKRRKKRGGLRDTCMAYYEKNTLSLPTLENDNGLTADKADEYCIKVGDFGCNLNTGESLQNNAVQVPFVGRELLGMEASNQARMDALMSGSGGRRKKRKSKTKKKKRKPRRRIKKTQKKKKKQKGSLEIKEDVKDKL